MVVEIVVDAGATDMADDVFSTTSGGFCWRGGNVSGLISGGVGEETTNELLLLTVVKLFCSDGNDNDVDTETGF